MIDLKSVLHRVGERIAAREDAFERLSERRGRKRRNQRISAGVVAVLVAVAGGVGVWAGFRNGTIVPPAGEDAENARVVALWPERTLSEIEAAEQRVVSGEDPWRLESESTAVRFASEVLGWSDPTVSIQIVPGPVDAAVADVTNPPAPCPAPPEGEPISLTCLGKRAEVFLHGFTGPGGIWSVTWVGGDRTRGDPDPPFAVSPGQVVEAHVDVPEGAQAIGGGSFFGDGCQASFGSERVTETGKIDLIVPPGDCLEGAAGEGSDGSLYVYVVGSGPAWDPDPTDTEELLAEDPLGGRSVDPMDLTLIRVHLASDTSPQPGSTSRDRNPTASGRIPGSPKPFARTRLDLLPSSALTTVSLSQATFRSSIPRDCGHRPSSSAARTTWSPPAPATASWSWGRPTRSRSSVRSTRSS